MTRRHWFVTALFVLTIVLAAAAAWLFAPRHQTAKTVSQARAAALAGASKTSVPPRPGVPAAREYDYTGAGTETIHLFHDEVRTLPQTIVGVVTYGKTPCSWTETLAISADHVEHDQWCTTGATTQLAAVHRSLQVDGQSWYEDYLFKAPPKLALTSPLAPFSDTTNDSGIVARRMVSAAPVTLNGKPALHETETIEYSGLEKGHEQVERWIAASDGMVLRIKESSSLDINVSITTAHYSSHYDYSLQQ